MHVAASNRTVAHTSLAARLMLGVLAVALSCGTANAGLLYDFKQAETGVILATLELASLPARPEQILRLDFSAAGEAIFGLPSPYPNSFQATHSFSWIDDGAGGLAGNDRYGAAGMQSVPPLSTTIVVGNPLSFSLFATGEPDGDAISYSTFVDAATYGDIVTEFGDWVIVPEPSTSALLLVGATLLGFAVAVFGSQNRMENSGYRFDVEGLADMTEPPRRRAINSPLTLVGPPIRVLLHPFLRPF